MGNVASTTSESTKVVAEVIEAMFEVVVEVVAGAKWSG
jgi:hypothetical protein